MREIVAVVCTVMLLIQSVLARSVELTPRDTFYFNAPPTPHVGYSPNVPKGLDIAPERHFNLETLSEQQLWQPVDDDYPRVVYSTVVVEPQRVAGGRVVVVPITQVLIVIPRWVFSNGQAGNWSSFPNGYLDARTLSFPMR